MIQMSGAPTGLLVTEGFRDEIEFRRCYKEDIWDPTLPGARSRSPAAGCGSRSPSGSRPRARSRPPLDEEAVRKAAARLRAFGVTSIAVVFLHSYLNPAHELRAREIILDEYPDVELISLSHEVLPEAAGVRADVDHAGQRVRRAADRALPRPARRPRWPDAGYHQRAARRDLGRRRRDAPRRPPTARSPRSARARPAASCRGRAAADGGPRRRRQRRHGRHQLRRLPDPRRPARAQDATGTGATATASRCRWSTSTSVGAGGGSIAWVEAGILHVGPRVGAGSSPARSATGAAAPSRPSPTPTSCSAGSTATGFWSGRMTLDVDAARAALGAVGDRSASTPKTTAAAVAALVDAHMTDAVRRVLSLAGADPRRLDLVAFGGMGAVHATTQARALGMRRVLIPRAAPGSPRSGLLTADHVVDDSRGYISPWADVDHDHLARLAHDLEVQRATGAGSCGRSRMTACGWTGRCCWSIPARPSIPRSVSTNRPTSKAPSPNSTAATPRPG